MIIGLVTIRIDLNTLGETNYGIYTCRMRQLNFLNQNNVSFSILAVGIVVLEKKIVY